MSASDILEAIPVNYSRNDRVSRLQNLKNCFFTSYMAGQLTQSLEIVRAFTDLYSESAGFGDLIENHSEDIRFAFRVEHDGCEILRSFVNMIEFDTEMIPRNMNNPAHPTRTRVNFLKDIIRKYPDFRFAINLLAIMLFEQECYSEALDAARISYNLKSNCPFGEHILQKIIRKLHSIHQLEGIQLNDIERTFLLELDDLFCLKPFTNFEIWRTGEVFVCCGAWLPSSIGNVFEQSADEIWNSQLAREIRRSILDGDFKYCSRSCLLIRNKWLMKKSDVLSGNISEYKNLWGILVYKQAPQTVGEIAKYLANHETKMEGGPRFVNLAHDFSCNLTCPSCRHKLKTADSAHEKKLDMVYERVILPILPYINEMLIAGDGEVFYSNHYRKILAALDKDKFPNLRVSILTNGLLFTENEWEKFKNVHELVYSVSVSIDAATEDTYRIVRRGGNWQKLMQNLDFLSKLHQEGEIPYFDLNFVIQKKNFREMKSFIKLGKKLGVDFVRFVLLRNDSETFSPEEFMDENVYDNRNPYYNEVVDILKDPIFQDPIVQYPKLTSDIQLF